jgi:hypothetical protein
VKSWKLAAWREDAVPCGRPKTPLQADADAFRLGGQRYAIHHGLAAKIDHVDAGRGLGCNVKELAGLQDSSGQRRPIGQDRSQEAALLDGVDFHAILVGVDQVTGALRAVRVPRPCLCRRSSTSRCLWNQ